MFKLLILPYIIQLILIVHVLKTGRTTTWVFILLFAPFIGGLAYLIVELLPEWSNSRGGMQVRRHLKKLANPDRDFKAAARNFEVADTVQNAMALAEECLAKERYDQARDLFERALRGVHEDDPVLLMGLARARFGLGDAAGTIETLDLLKAKNPGHTSTAGHLLYARAKEQLGDTTAAIEEYGALVQYYPGPEPACRLGALLKAQGRNAEAQELFQKVLSQSRISGRHYNSLHKEWVEMARREI
jgi:hypothetical protein